MINVLVNDFRKMFPESSVLEASFLSAKLEMFDESELSLLCEQLPKKGDENEN